MNFGRYKNTDWLLHYKVRRFHLYCSSQPPNPNAAQLERAAWLLLEAHYGGPWKMLYALFKREAGMFVDWYVWRSIHRIKRRLGLKPDEETLVAERFKQEEIVVNEMVGQL